MAAEDLGGVDRERRIDEDRDVGDAPLAEEFHQLEDDLLCAAHGEGRDEELPLPLDDVADDPCQTLRGRPQGLVVAIAVGALDDQHVLGPHAVGIADDRELGTAQVAAEDDGARLAVLLRLQTDDGRAEDVAGVVEGRGHPRRHRERFVVGVPGEVLEGAFRVDHGVERLPRRPVIAAPRRPLVRELGVLLLDVPRVAQHVGAEVGGRQRRVDGAAETALDQRGDRPGVVDVGVAQHDGVDPGGIERVLPVPPVGLIARPLHQSEVQ